MIKNLGMILLAVWLIMWGLITILALSFHGIWIVMGVLAILAGIFILLGK
jgi:hypothetical protein